MIEVLNFIWQNAVYLIFGGLIVIAGFVGLLLAFLKGIPSKDDSTKKK